MGITEKTTIQELLCDQHISSTTYDILDTAKLETVEMILQYTDYAQNFPKLFGISGLLFQNYKELQDIIFPLVQKQNEATRLRVKGYPNNCCFVQPNTKITIEELSENLLIPSDILPYFREIGIETFQDILDFKSESNVYKKYIKIRFGEDVFAKLTSAMRICQKAYVNSKKEPKKTNSTNQVQAENKGKNTMLGKHLPSWPFEGPAEWILRARAGFGYADVSPLGELKRAGGAPELPVLFIHGTADRLIPYDNTLRLYDAKRGKKALYICPGAAHVRSISTDREKYYAVVNEFLDKYGF